MAVIALDLGGTKLAAALFSARGLLSRRLMVALDGRSGSEVGKLISGLVVELGKQAAVKRQQIQGIGVSVPGIARADGTVWAPNIRGWEAYPLRRELALAAGWLDPGQEIPIVVENDRACSILGECWRGNARRCSSAVFLAVGTGIGAGILCDGMVIQGAHGTAGSLGWMALDRPFRTEYESCGCFEQQASGDGLAKVANELIEKARRTGDRLGHWSSTVAVGRHARRGSRVPSVTAEDVFAAYAQGDPIAREVLGQAVELWGMAVANLVSVFDPEKIIFGGGVFGPATRFLPAIRKEALKWAQPVSMRRVQLVPSKLGSAAALYGAAYLALGAAGGKVPLAAGRKLNLPKAGSPRYEACADASCKPALARQIRRKMPSFA